MKNPKIVALDLDEVVVETSPMILKNYNKTYGTNVKLSDYYQDNLKTWNVPDLDTLVKRVNEYAESKEYMSLKPVQIAIDTIHKLQEKYKLYIITGRPDFIELATRKWLAKNFPEVFEDVIFSNFFTPGGLNRRHKGDICVELGVDVLVDDHLEHITSAATNGVRGLLFGNFPWNQAAQLPPNVQRVKDWHEVAAILL